MNGWRQLQFFDDTPIPDPTPSEDGKLYGDSDVTATCSGDDVFYLATNERQVKAVTKSLTLERSFTAYAEGTITFMKYIPELETLLTVAEQNQADPIVKLWHLKKEARHSDTPPRCITTVIVTNNRKTFPISAFSTNDDFSVLAFGFANGSIVLVRGSLIQDRGSKQRIIYESQEPITGLDLYEAGKTLVLFASTVQHIYTFSTLGRNSGAPTSVLDEEGCPLGCSAIKKSTGEFVVARQDTLQYYTLKGLKQTYPLKCTKKKLYCHKDYIAVESPSGRDSSGTWTPINNAGASITTTQFYILDPENKLIVLSSLLVHSVNQIFSQWGDLFILTSDGILHRFHEKSLADKMSILCDRDLYSLAVKLATRAKAEKAEIERIHLKYADHLYDIGDYDKATSQYVKAIHSVEPSKVIIKFLDSRHIGNLITFLEGLHEYGNPTNEDTTLLINCYARLHDVDKLDAFIYSRKTETKFDLMNAAHACRRANYFPQTIVLAKRAHDWRAALDIMLLDMSDYSQALDFISSLDPESLFECLKQHGRLLVEKLPERTTQLFIDFFTGKYRAKSSSKSKQKKPVETAPSQSDIIPSYLNFRAMPMRSSTPQQQQQQQQPDAADSASIASSSSTKRSDKSSSKDQQSEITSSNNSTHKYIVPWPHSVYFCFISNNECFISFLESCLEYRKRNIQNDEKESIDGKSDNSDNKQLLDGMYITLFGLFLEQYDSASTRESKSEWELKARGLASEDRFPVNDSNVMVVSHLSSFRDIRLILREKNGFEIDLFRYCVSTKDVEGAVEVVNKYGDSTPELYALALSFYTISEDVYERTEPELVKVLDKLQDNNYLTPVQVVQLLSLNSISTVGVVKKYLTQVINKEKREIQRNEKLVTDYKREADLRLNEINRLNTEPKVFQATRCEECNGRLDLPTVNFLCGHSYHRRCLDLPDMSNNNQQEKTRINKNIECPRCAPQVATIRALRKAQDAMADRHDQFKQRLKQADDKMKVITEYFGRGIMERVVVEPN